MVEINFPPNLSSIITNIKIDQISVNFQSVIAIQFCSSGHSEQYLATLQRGRHLLERFSYSKVKRFEFIGITKYMQHSFVKTSTKYISFMHKIIRKNRVYITHLLRCHFVTLFERMSKILYDFFCLKPSF